MSSDIHTHTLANARLYKLYTVPICSTKQLFYNISLAWAWV